jgi:hypothetical protein
MSAFVRSTEGDEVQKRIWDETISFFQEHVPGSLLDELLGGLK